MKTELELEKLKLYAVPSQTGLGSDRRTCGKVIKSVLSVLQYPQMRFNNPTMPNSYAWSPENDGLSFEHDCMAFRIRLFQNLRLAGWRISHDKNGDIVIK